MGFGFSKEEKEGKRVGDIGNLSMVVLQSLVPNQY